MYDNPCLGVFNMSKRKKIQLFLQKSWKKSLVALLVAVIFIGISPFFEPKVYQAEINPADFSVEEELVVLEENSLLAISNPSNPEPKTVRKIKMVVTAYSSTPWETQGNPYLTASQKWVEEGIVANNLLPFGTKIKIPELYGDKIFVVEDRMHWRKGYYHLDIWFSSYWEAKNFGAKRAYIEILES